MATGRLYHRKIKLTHDPEFLQIDSRKNQIGTATSTVTAPSHRRGRWWGFWDFALD
jgi:hypothetical protein